MELLQENIPGRSTIHFGCELDGPSKHQPGVDADPGLLPLHASQRAVWRDVGQSPEEEDAIVRANDIELN